MNILKQLEGNIRICGKVSHSLKYYCHVVIVQVLVLDNKGEKNSGVMKMSHDVEVGDKCLSISLHYKEVDQSMVSSSKVHSGVDNRDARHNGENNFCKINILDKYVDII